MKNIFLVVLFFHATIASAQDSCELSKGSINSYYDALFLSTITNTSTPCESRRALNILAAYSAKGGVYSFKTKELLDLYKTAVRNLFSIDTVFNHFRKGYPGDKNAMIALNNFVQLYKKLDTIKIDFEKKDSSLRSKQITKKIAELFAINSDTLTKSKISIRDSLLLYSGDANFKEKVEKDTTNLENNLERTIQLSEEYKKTVSLNYQDSIQEYNRQLTELSSKMTKYATDHIESLDDILKNKIRQAPRPKSIVMNDLSVPNDTYRNSVTSDAFYEKNETYTLTNFKLPTQTEMIDALAIYLAKRFKQEVALTLIDNFRKILRNDQVLVELFPETIKMFNTGKVYEMPSFGSAWNYSISKDFNNLLPNLAKSYYVTSKIGDSVLVGQLQDVVSMCTLINKQFSYVDVVSTLYHQGTNSNFFSENIATLHIINKELFDTASAARFWVNAEKLYLLDEEQLKIFFALVQDKYKERSGIFKYVDIEKALKLKNLLSSTLVVLNNFQSAQRKLLQAEQGKENMQLSHYWEFLNQLFEMLNTRMQPNITPYTQKILNISNYCFETYGLLTQKNYAGAALKIMDILPEIRNKNYVDFAVMLISAKKLNNISATERETVIKKFDELSRLFKQYFSTRSFIRELNNLKGDYRSVLNDSRFLGLKLKAKENRTNQNYSPTNLLETLNSEIIPLKEKLIALANDIDILYNKYTDKKVSKFVNLLIENYESNDVQNYINTIVSDQFDSFRKLTSFLSDLLLAGSSKNLSLVIEKYALPPNSYKIKRESRSSWDLNAYVGVYAGVELLDSSDDKKFAPVYGFSAPIGISYSWAKTKRAPASAVTSLSGKKPRTPKGNSLTITLSVIDIGAVVSYRLGNTGEGLPQEVKWSQLLSPGLHFRWGLKNTPLCISAGIQNTPQLRKIQNVPEPVSTIRSYAGLFFDLPLYNISHK